ncbi:MAG TPA: integrase core domain-containing protein [Bryobacteraceae bacterium]|nr:integrase core domain-containing protein [Bryobacteraceae bacterium]
MGQRATVSAADRDRIFGHDFVEQVKAMGIKQVLSASRSPWQRAYVERVIGTIRRECLDHMVVCNESTLSRHLQAFIGLARTLHWRRMRLIHAVYSSPMLATSSPSLKWAGCITGTNAGRPDYDFDPPPQEARLKAYRMVCVRNY